MRESEGSSSSDDKVKESQVRERDHLIYNRIQITVPFMYVIAVPCIFSCSQGL